MSPRAQDDPPPAEAPVSSRKLRPLLRLVPFFGRYPLQIAFSVAALTIAAGATLAIPIAVRRVIDHGFSAEGARLVNRYFLAMLAVVLILACASAVRFYFVTWLGERVVADLRDRIFAHLLALSPAFYERSRTGEIVSRLTADTTQVKLAFSTSASIALRNLAMFIGAVVMMVVSSPKLSGLVLLAIPLIVLPLVLFGRKVRSLSRSAQDTLAASAALAQERLGAVAIVQSFVQEAFAGRQFAVATQDAFDSAVSRTRARAALTAAIITLSLGSVVVVLWYGAQDVIAGVMTGGQLGQFVLYAILAASSLGELSQVWGDVQSAAGAAERLSELLDEMPDIQPPANPLPLPLPPPGTVAFDRVSFRYPTRLNEQALHDIDFSVSAGERIAIVGPSGAGKTTIFALLQRFYDPESGRVLIDGVEIRNADPQALRARIAVVPQETVIFSGTLADNIRFGRPEASRDDVLAAAKTAHVDEFAETLPKGYDTELGERGITLSGGQRQRVAIARAVLKNAPILLLDEATSALDAASEALIQEALAELTAHRTSIVIAHRLATVRDADRIIVLDGGHLVATGTHDELIAANLLYAELARLQFSAPSA